MVCSRSHAGDGVGEWSGSGIDSRGGGLNLMLCAAGSWGGFSGVYAMGSSW